MLEIKGRVNTAVCFARVIEDEAIEQIRRMCDYDFTAGSRIFSKSQSILFKKKVDQPNNLDPFDRYC